ncbi:MAG: 2-isopropylmalate synthase [Fimbriimonas ginsengisoli]|uniref:2-isopropylmalate synthase n=1 Tax=Fimbriimonas ginsengisoli TaxID=1005039 RepID=A0A931PTM0_FIMGI|nr:2-isopropylmalate synthase [Fimbriimonas ginsengisoli]
MATDRVLVFDTTLRDGEQSPGVRLSVQEKLEIGRGLVAMGVDVIEAGFPISSPGDFEAVETLAKNLKGVTICALTRARDKDIDVAAEAVKAAESPRIHTGLGVSDNHLQFKLRMSRDEALATGVAAVKHARQYTDNIEYFMEDSGRADRDYVYRVAEGVIAAGATTVNVPDTTGYAYPEEYRSLIAGIMENVPNSDKAVFSCHCHNDLGMATANTLAGVLGGARQVEVTVNGIGERAGNTSLEEVVMALQIRADYFHVKTGIDSTRLLPMSRLVAKLTGMMVQRNKAVVGANAYAHSSGIHQDGVLKERSTYEIIDPRLVGAEKSEIILTARSGRHGLRHRLAEMGFNFTEERFELLYEEFLRMADTKHEVVEEDLRTLVG